MFFVVKEVVMAEFCLDCLNKYYKDKKLTEKDVILDEDLCEECGKWKPCVIKIKQKRFSVIKSLYKKITSPL